MLEGRLPYNKTKRIDGGDGVYYQIATVIKSIYYGGSYLITEAHGGNKVGSCFFVAITSGNQSTSAPHGIVKEIYKESYGECKFYLTDDGSSYTLYAGTFTTEVSVQILTGTSLLDFKKVGALPPNAVEINPII